MTIKIPVTLTVGSVDPDVIGTIDAADLSPFTLADLLEAAAVEMRRAGGGTGATS